MNEVDYPFSILFVEDEDALRHNYVAYLKMIFTEVYEAKDGEEAYSVYLAKKPDIMIVDLSLPKMSGLEFLQKVRQKDHSTKAIVLTAHTDTEFLLDAVSLKLTKYLVKPISRKVLYDTLQLALEEMLLFRISPVGRIKINHEYSWESERQQLCHFDEVVSLTNNEQRFLSLLFSDVTKVFQYDEIFDFMWSYDTVGTSDALKSLVKMLRKKLPKECIKNVFGIGYKIEIIKK